jgi:capsular exopolysaccharide synthesis family protein
MANAKPTLEQMGGAQQAENRLRFFMNTLVRYWLMIALCTIVASSAWGVLGLYRGQKADVWVASTKLTIDKDIWDSEYLRNLRAPSIVSLDARLLVQRLRDDPSWSTDVAIALVQDDLEKGHPRAGVSGEGDYKRLGGEILGAVQFVAVKDSQDGTLEIKVTRGDRAEAKRIAELVARVIVERNRQYVLDSEAITHASIQDELDRVRDLLEATESEEWTFRKDMGFRTYEHVLTFMQSTEQDLTKAKTGRKADLAKMAQILQQLDQRDDDLQGSLGNITDAVVTDLMAELSELLRERLEMQISYFPEYKGLQDKNDEIQEKEEAIRLAWSELDAGPEGSGVDVWSERLSLRDQYRQLQLNVASTDIRIETMTGMLHEEIANLPDLEDKSRAHEQLKREKDTLTKQFDTMFDKLIETQTALQRGSSQIKRANEVTAGLAFTRDGWSSKWFPFVLGGFVGFVAGFGMAMLLEAINTSIRRPEDVAEYLDLDLIGTIPLMIFGRARRGRRGARYVIGVDEGEVDASLITKHDPKSPISEAYRALRTRFQFATIEMDPRTVMVTSSVPGEGKTTTAVNMAVTMADSGLRVLLLDTDLRRPNVHRVLRMERGTGLADVLREGLDVRSAIRPTQVENLWMISSGRVPPNPSELIGSERMTRVMARLGTAFDIVICDAPSLHVVTDPVLLSKQVDTTIMVVAAEHASRETIVRAKNLLDTSGSPVAGVVLNALQATRRNHYYYYYYYDDRSIRRPGKWAHRV